MAVLVNPFRTAVPFWGPTTHSTSEQFAPKTGPAVLQRFTEELYYGGGP